MLTILGVIKHLPKIPILLRIEINIPNVWFYVWNYEAVDYN